MSDPVFDQLGYRPTTVQQHFHDSTGQWREFRAGHGAGKTRALVADTVRACATHPGITAAVVAATWAEVSHIATELHRMPLDQLGATWNLTRRTLTLANGSTIRFWGVNNADQAIRYAGVELQQLVYDELDDLPVDAQRFLDSRLRSGRDTVPVLGFIASGPPERDLNREQLDLCAWAGWSRNHFRRVPASLIARTLADRMLCEAMRWTRAELESLPAGAIAYTRDCIASTGVAPTR